MNIVEIVLIVASSLFYLITIIFSFLTKKPPTTLFMNTFVGLVAFAVLDLTSHWTNSYIPINVYTVSGCGLFGIPALLCFLVLKVIFI